VCFFLFLFYFRFVPQQQAWIVERMGKFHRILEPGLAILIPVLDKIQYVKSLKEAAIEIPSQSAITADNVTLDLDVCGPLMDKMNGGLVSVESDAMGRA
jgi:regulator of protease activity HflC (stomatin/prohibitin superfamily)